MSSEVVIVLVSGWQFEALKVVVPLVVILHVARTTLTSTHLLMLH